MKESYNIIQANITNLTSIWRQAAELFDSCYLLDDFNYCFIENSDWPNRLWFNGEITETIINEVKDKLFSTPNPITVSCWNIDDGTSYNLLKKAGFKEKSVQIGMSLELKERPKKKLRLNFNRVSNADQAGLWAEIYPKAFGYRISEEIVEKSWGEIEFYLATYDEEPVGTAIVYQTGNIVGIHGIGIIPDKRRQGFAEEIMEFALNRAAILGASHVTLQASVMGKGLYRKLGFKEDFVLKNYVLDQNMKEVKKEDIKQEVFDLYDDYVHSRLNRADFELKLAAYAVNGLTVSALLNFIMPNYISSVQIKQNDPRLKSEHINYNAPKGGGNINALLSMPAATNHQLSGLIVVHENRGLNPHIEDVTRRAALAGFISIAPDALTPLGGYPGNDDAGRHMHDKRDPGEMLEVFIAAYDYLKNHKRCNGKIGVVGFCFGGTIANSMAVQVPDLLAAAAFYGGQPAVEDVPKIQASLMLHYAELDTVYNAGWPTYETALKANDKKYKAYIYPKTNHGFHNDTTPRYDKVSAELAWKRTIDFFKMEL